MSRTNYHNMNRLNKIPVKNITIRASMPAYEWLNDTFPKHTYGAGVIVNTFKYAYDKDLASIKGYFTQRELYLMIDCMKNIDVIPTYVPPDRFLVDMVKRSIDDNRSAQKWDTDGDVLIRKLSHLRYQPFLLLCLAIWVYGCDHGQHKQTKHEYVSNLLEES